jgi:hypothetical protein
MEGKGGMRGKGKEELSNKVILVLLRPGSQCWYSNTYFLMVRRRMPQAASVILIRLSESVLFKGFRGFWGVFLLFFYMLVIYY